MHLSSGGGDLFDGLAIYEALRQHAGHVTIAVDALAASAASVIAMAGDTVEIAPGGMMMVHDAITATYGNAGEHRKTAGLLDKASDVLAGIYAARAGGTWPHSREAPGHVVPGPLGRRTVEARAYDLQARGGGLAPLADYIRVATARPAVTGDAFGESVGWPSAPRAAPGTT